jgi:hypothetical protein
VLFVLFAMLGVFAYPLMLPFPAVAVGVAAVLEWRRRRAAGEPLPRLRRPHLPAGGLRRALAIVAAVPVGFLLLVLFLGVIEKGLRGFQALLPTTDLAGWRGDSPDYPLAHYFGMPDVPVLGPLAVIAVCAAAAYGIAPLRGSERLGLVAMAAGAALMALSFALRESGEYFLFKTLAFLGPIVAIAAVVGLARLTRGRRRALAATGAAGLAVLAIAFVWGTRNEIEPFPMQVTPEIFELRDWPGRLPPDASIRIDVPPTGEQLWVAYMLHERPLSSLVPVIGTSYPALHRSRKADYALVGKGIPRPPGAEPRPVLRNGHYRLYRLKSLPGVDRSSRSRIQPELGSSGGV